MLNTKSVPQRYISYVQSRIHSKFALFLGTNFLLWYFFALSVQQPQRQTWLGKVTGKPNSRQRSAYSDSVIVNSVRTYGITPLSPGEPGRCWFHSQLLHKQDREIFKRLGGAIDDTSCEKAGVLGARYTSEAEICSCTAPPESSFQKNFLEIGSADGQYLSNLLFFEMQLKWRGICVEGSPVSFEMLQRNRPDCVKVNAVIGPTQGQTMFYTFDSPNSWEIGMSCMQGGECGKNDDEAQKYADERKLTLHKQQVPMRKLSEIFAENNMNNFGWITVDVQGAEDIVIPTVDLNSVHADYISYETSNDIDNATARDHLISAGYQVEFTIGPDKFYMLRQSEQAPPSEQTPPKPAGVDACDFANLFEDMWEEKDAGALLREIEKRGGANESVRQKFMQDLFSVFHSHGVKFWLEEGTLIQMVRNVTRMPDEPATLPFGDIDVGIRDTELFASGPLAQAMVVLKLHRFRIIRCGRQIFTLERDGDYVDVMIFASSAPACQVREPNSVHKCSDGIAPYVLHTHQQQWNFLKGGLVSLPGSSLLETVDYLEAMFGTTWYQHDVPNWRRTQSPNPGGGGQSANWERTDSRLKSKPKRFTLDRLGAVPDPKMCAAPCLYTFQSVLAHGKRLVRIDDYPYPDKTPIALQRKWLEQAIMPFERRGVPYLLGVSPHRLAYDDVQEHVDFLNRVVTKGYICMHGFTHRTDEHTDKIRTTVWERGGEFAKYETEDELESQWLKGDAILQKLQRYTREHFIPPFNALTQMMVNVLMRKGTRFIHSFDAALCERPARAIPHPDVGGNFGGCLEDMRVRQSAVFVVSEWKRTYADADELRIEPHGSQITLHWYFDAKKSTFPRSYEDLSKKLLASGDERAELLER